MISRKGNFPSGREVLRRKAKNGPMTVSVGIAHNSMVRRIFGWPRLDGRECPSAIGRFLRSPLPVVVISFHQICLLCDMF